jgi:hypothetical protein
LEKSLTPKPFFLRLWFFEKLFFWLYFLCIFFWNIPSDLKLALNSGYSASHLDPFQEEHNFDHWRDFHFFWTRKIWKPQYKGWKSQKCVCILDLGTHLCPTEEESDMLMSSMMVNVHMRGVVGGKGVFGVRQGADNGAVDLEHGTGMGRRSHSHTKSNHSK